MALTREHDLHRRRWGRNLGLGLTLGAFIVLVFGLTIELAQSLTTWRQGDVWDWLADAIGIAVVMLCARLTARQPSAPE